MGEKLIIKNFGPIKSVELELGRFNVLIGEQATGKSTVAKVLAVCRYFSYIIKVDEPVNEDPVDNYFSLGLAAWGLKDSVNKDTFIYYECSHYSTTITTETFTVPTYNFETEEFVDAQYERLIINTKPISIEFKNLLIELDSIKNSSDLDLIDWNAPVSFYTNEVARVLDNPFYFPAERSLQSIFSLGKSSIRNLSDSLFNQFAKLDQIARLFKRDVSIDPLNIIYKNVNGKGFIRKNNEEKFYSIYTSASGYQSTIPIVLVIKYYNDLKKKKKTFVIEEPELSLFPTAQQKLIEYLVGSTINSGSSVFINTHSPYVLSSINNLLYAYKVGQTNEEAVNEIIPKSQWLDPSQFTAYKLLSDGTAKNIVDDELQEIMVEELDGAGKDINAVYDRILDIKFKSNEKSKRLSQLQ